VSLSSVHFATGAATDIDAVGARLRERGVLFCVDAIQSFGALPVTIKRLPCDFSAMRGSRTKSVKIYYLAAAPPRVRARFAASERVRFKRESIVSREYQKPLWRRGSQVRAIGTSRFSRPRSAGRLLRVSGFQDARKLPAQGNRFLSRCAWQK
jgi:hypothetical protein